MCSQICIFETVMTSMINSYFPIKITKVHSKDKPWITPHFKDLIKQRQVALHTDRNRYKALRNRINREQTSLRKHFYKSKINQLTQNDPKQWWRHVKDVVGLTN